MPRENILTAGADLWQRLHGKRVFLTGGTGFFGRSLLDLLGDLKVDIKLTILTRDIKKFKTSWNGKLNLEKINFQEGEITNFPFLDEEFDYILHFATPASSTFNSEHPLEMFNIIVDGSKRVYEFARHCKAKTVLLASSGAAYGKQPNDLGHISEDYTGAPSTVVSSSAYGEGKRVAELMGTMYARNYGFDFKIARCFAFVGPHLDFNGNFAIGNFIRDAVLGKPITIQGDGSAIRSYLYSDDLILWLFKILLDGKTSQIYNVGSDEAISIREIAEKVVSSLNLNNKIEVLGKKREGFMPERYVPSIELAKSELGLKVYTSLDKAISFCRNE